VENRGKMAGSTASGILRSPHEIDNFADNSTLPCWGG
jgi:hypothetical protein